MYFLRRKLTHRYVTAPFAEYAEKREEADKIASAYRIEHRYMTAAEIDAYVDTLNQVESIKPSTSFYTDQKQPMLNTLNNFNQKWPGEYEIISAESFN